MSHTPGPWNLKNETGKGAAVYCGKLAIATVYDSANARLIVAAPELLEALEDLVPIIPDKDAMCHVGICSQEQCAYCQRVIRAHAAIAKAEAQ